MGTSNSKHRSLDLAKKGNHTIAVINGEESRSYRDMEGPSFYCAYLGFIALSKPPTNLNALQSPVKELYFKYRKTPASGRSANMKLIQNGVLVVLYENGSVKAELFFDFSSVAFVEAAKFATVKTSSEKKPKAMFVPVDESKGAVSDKNAFPLEKSFHFLVTSTHPPLVVCVVRRPTGVKALDCHVFGLDTIENALHISALIASAQTPSGQLVQLDSGGDAARGKAVFDRGARGDVIRTDHGEYSVYRGNQGFETPPSQRYSGGPVTETQPGQWYGLGPIQSPGRNGQMGPPSGTLPGGGIMLTQDNFRDPSSPSHPYTAALGSKGYGMYEQPNYGAAQGGGYLRQPDVIMHTRQRSGDSVELSPHDRSFSGLEQTSAGVRVRQDEVVMRNNANSRLSGGPLFDNRISEGQITESRNSGGHNHESRISAGQNTESRISTGHITESRISAGHDYDSRLSGGPPYDNRLTGGSMFDSRMVGGHDIEAHVAGRQVTPGNRISGWQGAPSGNMSPRPNELSGPGYMGGPQYPHFLPDPTSSHLSPMAIPNSPRSPQAVSPTSPRGFDQRDHIGPVYSASNLESRNKSTLPDVDEQSVGARPVAKVPPHMIGVKVLPSDFRMVKLKPKSDKRPDVPDNEVYDTNKELLGKFKEVQEQPVSRSNNYPGKDVFKEFGSRYEEQGKEISSQWSDHGKDHRPGVAGNDSGPGDFSSRYEDNNNKSRFAVPSYGEDPDRNWGQRPHPGYNAGSSSPANEDPYARTKDLEIANMFSNFKLQGGSSRDVYRQPRDRNEIEDGLGYLP